MQKIDEQGSLSQPLPSGSVVEQIIKRLTEALVNRELQPGQKIPTEMELCERLQVGRNSVREAIKILVTMGVLEIRRSEGTYVCQGFSGRMLDPLVYGLILEGGGSDKLIELRRIFDKGILQTAVERATKEHIEEIHRQFEAFKSIVNSTDDEKTILEADIAFHSFLENVLDNPLVNKISIVINRLTYPTRLLASKEFIMNGEKDKLIQLHQHLVNIIVNRDSASVSSAMEEHFQYWQHIVS
jgi:GntR family transcriptional repressor for pyruvate dehydrogenase complex